MGSATNALVIRVTLWGPLRHVDLGGLSAAGAISIQRKTPPRLTHGDAIARSADAVVQRSYPSARTGADGARTVPPPRLATSPSRPHNAWAGSLETLLRISHPKQDRGEDGMSQVVRGTHCIMRLGPPNHRSPNPRGNHETFQCTRHCRD